MSYIGSRRMAKQAQEVHDHNYHNGNTGSEDWECVGGGSFRTVYLHKPTGVCYKVDTGYDQPGYGNTHEVRNAQRLLRRCKNNDQWLNEFVRIPKVSGYSFSTGVVVAMEFIAGTIGRKATTTEPARKALHSLKFSDMHGENFIVDESGTIWPVDLASPLPGHPDYSGPDNRALNQRGGF